MKALVTKSTGLWYEVKVENLTYIARLRGKFKLEGKKLTNPIAVGDWVEIIPNAQMKNEWVITHIYERENYVVRSSPRKKGHDHLIASNIDQGVLIVTLKMPRTSIGFIDRFLITLEAFRIPGIILINKKDLYGKKDMDRYEQLKAVYEKIGYRVFLNQFDSKIDLSVRAIFENKRSLLAGHSGAGKSTLVNQLVPRAQQEVREVSGFANKGVHTTTFAELFFIDESSSVIDTPGIKELGLSEIADEELSHYFPEMRKFLGECKFHNCLHVNEPGCAVRASVGVDIDEIRYKNYLNILQATDNRN